MRVQQKPFYADLFSKTSPTVLPAIPSLKVAPSPAPVSARPPEDEVKNTRTAPGKEIVLSGKGRALAPLDKTPDSKTDGVALSDPAPGKPSALRGIIGNVDAHNLSPREMTNLSQDLYAAGVISFEEYSLLAFQPELHPDYDRTIGALTGEIAAPNQRRDFVHIWQERASFHCRHNANRPDLVAQSEQIAQVLGRIESPTNVVV